MASTAVTNFHGTYPLVISSKFADVQRCTGLEGIKGFDNQAFFTQEKTSRAEEFIFVLEKNLGSEKGKSSIKTLLQRILQLSASDESATIFAQITPAFFKQEGYLRRLFSKESWAQWTDNRTPLGKIVFQLRDYTENHTGVRKFVQSLDKSEIQQANEEASALLKTLDQSKVPPMKMGLSLKDFNFPPRNSCVNGLIGGTVASLATKNPLPLLMGLSGCLPKVFAQQKVGSEFPIKTYTNYSQMTNPSIAGLTNGNFVVAWEKWGGAAGSVDGVYGQLFDGTANKIGNEFQANSFSFGNSPAASGLRNGRFVVTLESYDGYEAGIFGQLFDANASKIGNEFQVNTYILDVQSRNSVASLNNGNFVVTWDTWAPQDGDSFGVFGQLFDGNASKIGNEFQVNTYTQSSQQENAIASLSNGNFVVVWQSWGQDGDQNGIYGQIFTENVTKFGNEFQVNTNTTGDQEGPSVVGLPNGNFVVVWYPNCGQLFEEHANKIGSEFQIPSSPIKSLDDGTIITVWLKNRGMEISDIYCQLFDANTNKIGRTLMVNPDTPLGRGGLSIGNLSNENFVVTWHRYNFSTGYDVYGQIFNSTVLPPLPQTQVSETSKLSGSTSGFLWLWLLLGGIGGTSCLGLMGYLSFKRSKKDSGAFALDSGEDEQTLDELKQKLVGE